MNDQTIVLNYLAAFERLFPLDKLPKVKRVGDKFKTSWGGHRYPLRTRAYLIEETEHMRGLFEKAKPASGGTDGLATQPQLGY